MSEINGLSPQEIKLRELEQKNALEKFADYSKTLFETGEIDMVNDSDLLTQASVAYRGTLNEVAETAIDNATKDGDILYGELRQLNDVYIDYEKGANKINQALSRVDGEQPRDKLADQDVNLGAFIDSFAANPEKMYRNGVSELINDKGGKFNTTVNDAERRRDNDVYKENRQNYFSSFFQTDKEFGIDDFEIVEKAFNEYQEAVGDRGDPNELFKDLKRGLETGNRTFSDEVKAKIEQADLKEGEYETFVKSRNAEGDLGGITDFVIFNNAQDGLKIEADEMQLLADKFLINEYAKKDATEVRGASYEQTVKFDEFIADTLAYNNLEASEVLTEDAAELLTQISENLVVPPTYGQSTEEVATEQTGELDLEALASQEAIDKAVEDGILKAEIAEEFAGKITNQGLIDLGADPAFANPDEVPEKFQAGVEDFLALDKTNEFLGRDEIRDVESVDEVAGIETTDEVVETENAEQTGELDPTALASQEAIDKAVEAGILDAGLAEEFAGKLTNQNLIDLGAEPALINPDEVPEEFQAGVDEFIESDLINEFLGRDGATETTSEPAAEGVGQYNNVFREGDFASDFQESLNDNGVISGGEFTRLKGKFEAQADDTQQSFEQYMLAAIAEGSVSVTDEVMTTINETSGLVEMSNEVALETIANDSFSAEVKQAISDGVLSVDEARSRGGNISTEALADLYNDPLLSGLTAGVMEVPDMYQASVDDLTNSEEMQRYISRS
jgi:hypothetical protein